MGQLKQLLQQRRRRVLAEEYPELTLKEEDPVKWEVFYTKLQGLVSNSRETAIHISSSPVVREMGECVFALFTPEGESVTFSRGIVLHVASMGGSIRFMLDNDYEEEVGINHGDFFFNNDPYLGGAHSQDQTLLTPIHVDGELIGWAGGLTHVPETGAKEAGGTAVTGISRFEEGIFWPCLKVGENDRLKRDVEMIVERGTRTPIWWLMDTRAKAAAIVQIREGIVKLIEEYGLEFYRRAIYEYIEDTRRACFRKLQRVFYPGTYNAAVFFGVPNARRPVLHQRDWLVRVTTEMKIAPDGSVELDFDGTSPAGLHTYNSTESATIGNLLLGVIQYVLYDVKYNEGLFQAVFHPTRLRLPHSVLNPPNHTYGSGLWGPGAGGTCWGTIMDCMSRAYYARGFREEVSGHRNSGAGGLRWAGTDQYGRPSAGQNFEMGCAGMPASAVMDGLDTSYSAFNPEGDMSDAEVWERVFPFVWLGRSIQRDGGGFGRYRGGAAIQSTYLVEHVESIQVSTSGVGRFGSRSPGLMGAYPVGASTMYTYSMPNFEEAIGREAPLPSFGVPALRETAPDSALAIEPKAHAGNRPVQQVQRHDLIVMEEGGAGGFGDPIDRLPFLVAQDVRYGLTSSAVAQRVYGVVLDPGSGEPDPAATDARRAEIRRERLARGRSIAQYVAEQRDRVLGGRVPGPTRDSFNDCFAISEKFRRQYVECWALPPDFRHVPAEPVPSAALQTPNPMLEAAPCNAAREHDAPTPSDRTTEPGQVAGQIGGDGWDLGVLRDMLDGRLDSETLRRIQRAPKQADRFEKIVAVEQRRVPWHERILVPLQEHLFVVERADGRRVVKCECGQEFGDYRNNWKLSALVYERDTEDGEVYSTDHSYDPEWMILREFYCPGCGAQLEVEAIPPTHPIVFSALPDIDGFERWRREAAATTEAI